MRIPSTYVLLTNQTSTDLSNSNGFSLTFLSLDILHPWHVYAHLFASVEHKTVFYSP